MNNLIQMINDKPYVYSSRKWSEWRALRAYDYYEEGILYDTIDELKRIGYDIPMVWNKWIYEEGKWVLFGVYRDKWEMLNDKYITLWVEGIPGTEPSDDMKESILLDIQQKEKERQEEWDKYWKEETFISNVLDKAVGGKVIEVNKEENYILIETTEGVKIRITSTNKMKWDGKTSSSLSYLIKI